MTPEIILDTNVLFAALNSRFGASFKLLNLISDGKVRAHLSLPLLLQYWDVLTRNIDVLQTNAEDIATVIGRLCHLGHYHEIYYLWRPFLPDRKDDLILELAVAARCSHIVTHNIRDFRGVESFGIKASSPIEFIQEFGDKP